MDEMLLARFWSKVDVRATDECWFWSGRAQKDGYGAFDLNGRKVAAHRVAWMVAHDGEEPGKLCVCHRCDIRMCVNPAHLFLGTHSENVADRVSKGRSAPPRGSGNGQAKLTEQQAGEIRTLWAQGAMSQGLLAKRYGITQSVVHALIHRRTWRHVP